MDTFQNLMLLKMPLCKLTNPNRRMRWDNLFHGKRLWRIPTVPPPFLDRRLSATWLCWTYLSVNLPRGSNDVEWNNSTYTRSTWEKQPFYYCFMDDTIIIWEDEYPSKICIALQIHPKRDVRIDQFIPGNNNKKMHHAVFLHLLLI